ncbi:Ig-like domain-containing protein, partial [Candidatus Uhrbacteria bacterium]|nr:Ig-like domain-containing protein [Candidatus Uhrbacteria bacterium]
STLSPTDDATSIATTSDLVMTFDEAVDVKSGNISIYTTIGDTLFESISVVSGNVTGTGTDTITINPTGTFAELIGYYAKVVTSAFDDIYGNSFAGITDTTSWSFTTIDSTNPTVSTLTPVDDEASFSKTANLVIVFD